MKRKESLMVLVLFFLAFVLIPGIALADDGADWSQGWGDFIDFFGGLLGTQIATLGAFNFRVYHLVGFIFMVFVLVLLFRLGRSKRR